MPFGDVLMRLVEAVFRVIRYGRGGAEGFLTRQGMTGVTSVGNKNPRRELNRRACYGEGYRERVLGHSCPKSVLGS